MGIIYDMVMLADNITNRPKWIRFTSYLGMWFEGCLSGREFFTLYLVKQKGFVSLWVPLIGIFTVRSKICEELFYYR